VRDFASRYHAPSSGTTQSLDESGLVATIAERLVILNERIERAAERSGRTRADVRLVAVAKTVPCDDIALAIAGGVTEVGENKVQEAERKVAVIGNQVLWHMVGHLQTNKVKKAVGIFDWIQSVDSIRLLDRVNRAALELDRRPSVLLQVNTSGEDSKFGVDPSELTDLVHLASECEGVRVEGLMTIGPMTDIESQTRQAFQRLRLLAEDIRRWNVPRVSMRHLSMGMTGDFEIAIEEGATIVRIGTAIFGPRPTP
jgi:hypothetical protein